MDKNESKDIVERKAAPAAEVTDKGVQFSKLDEIWWFCNRVIESNMAPKDCKSASDILVRAQCGMSCGLNFMASIQYVSNVNGRPRMWGPPVKGLILSSGKCKKWQEKMHGNDPLKDDFYVEITIERTDLEGEQTVRFGTRDARRAGLLGRDTYKQYPEDMILYRAVGRVATRHFPDVIHGLSIIEDSRDIIDVEATTDGAPPIPRNLQEVAEQARSRRKAQEAEVEPEPDENGEVPDDDNGIEFGADETDEDSAPFDLSETETDDAGQTALC